MELRKLLAVLIAALRLFPRRQSLLALGVLLVIKVVVSRIFVVEAWIGDPLASGFFSILLGLIQAVALVAIMPVLARALATEGNLRGAVAWPRFVLSGFIAITALFLAVAVSTSLVFAMFGEAPDAVAFHSVLALLAGIGNLAWFIPLIHLALASRGDLRLGPGGLPGALRPARFAWLGGAFTMGAVVYLLEFALRWLFLQPGSGSLRLVIFVNGLGGALETVLFALYAIAAADYATGRRSSELEPFA